jgi:replicative DNA helicase
MNSKKNNLQLDYGKLPPQHLDFEEAVIGACLLEKDTIEEVINIVKPESFYKEEHQIIFEAICDLFNKNKQIDMLIIMNYLVSNGKINEIGGAAYLTQLTSKIASGAHAIFHAMFIQEAYIKRSLINAATLIQSKCYDSSEELSSILDFANESINKASTTNIKKLGEKIGEIGRKRLKVLEKVLSSGEKKTGIKSFNKVDKLTGGWQEGNLIILAARPGDGKTRLAQEIAKIAANSMKGKPVIIFSLEMEDYELYDRELSSETGINTISIRKADFSENDWTVIEEAQGRIEDLNIIIDPQPYMTINELKSRARLYKKKNDAGMIIVDYLQLLSSPQHSRNREQEVAYISRQLKSLAKELKMPIIALSQMSRDIEKRSIKRPQLSDLRESGGIEQDADIVLFLFRPENYGITEDELGESLEGVIEIIIAKARGASIGTVRIYHSKPWTHIFENKNDLFTTNYSNNVESGEEDLRSMAGDLF